MIMDKLAAKFLGQIPWPPKRAVTFEDGKMVLKWKSGHRNKYALKYRRLKRLRCRVFKRGEEE